MTKPSHEDWMEMALKEAQMAADKDEVPVGAIVVFENRVYGRGHNRMRSLNDPTAHAEMIAITAACNTLGQSRLENATMYVTLEPCAMCAGAMVLARIKSVHFGNFDSKSGACGSVFDVVRDPRLNHRLEVYGGLLANQSLGLLQDFFEEKRGSKDD